MNEIDQKIKTDIYFFLILIGCLIGACALIYCMSPVTIDSIALAERSQKLTITQMEFTTLNESDIIILHVTSLGTSPVTVDVVKINDDKITKDSIHSLTIEPGDSGIIGIEYDWITGNSYTVDIFTPDGIRASSYTETA
jgi:hypothetical protein